jgi:ribonucleoside-triphosphate reductase
MDWLILERMFSTVGIIALWESLKEMGYNITTSEGIDFAKKVFSFIEKKLEGYSKEDGVAFNLEQIPGEGAASTLAKQDKIYFNDENYPYQLYSNQFVPLFEDVDLIDRANIDGQLCASMTGGSICHLNIGCAATPQQMEDLIKYAVECGLEHFALNPSFNICENEHISLGKSTDKVCPMCGGKIVNNYTRVVGYFTDVKNWNQERRDCDFPNRKFNYLEDSKKENAA